MTPTSPNGQAGDSRSVDDLIGRVLGQLRAMRSLEANWDGYNADPPSQEVLDYGGRFLDVFRSDVGLSPKAFCRIRRFAAVLRRLERAVNVDWIDVALSCGYFDQAHFNHDFRAFSGLSPSAYLRQQISRTHVVLTP